MERRPQTYANHVKWDPAFHFFLLPVVIINLISSIVRVARFPSWEAGWFLVLSLAFFIAIMRIRSYGVGVQSRVIRLEERLRLVQLLPENLRSRIGELSDTQLVGLRFASDGELCALVQRALEENLTLKDIKQAVTSWRPDYSRI